MMLEEEEESDGEMLGITTTKTTAHSGIVGVDVCEEGREKRSKKQGWRNSNGRLKRTLLRTTRELFFAHCTRGRRWNRTAGESPAQARTLAKNRIPSFSWCVR
jgi:hypothetical protein